MHKTRQSKAEPIAKKPSLRGTKLPTEERGKTSKKQIILDKRLIKAVSSSKTSEVERLLKKGASANAKDKDGKTALMDAASNVSDRRMDICRLLVEKGADVNAKEKTGMTALHYAAGWGGAKPCAFLILNGADIWAETRTMRRTAASVAESRFEFKTEEFLKAVEAFEASLGEEAFKTFISDFGQCVSSP
jgi:ankyrin repeat protein